MTAAASAGEGPRFFGVDLAWGLGLPTRIGGPVKQPNETGLCLLDATGGILDAGWARGVSDVATWILDRERPGDVIAIDAPLIVANPSGMRQAEREVGRGYGRWKVGANASSMTSAARAGVLLLERLAARGVRYTDGTAPAPAGVTVAFECYPYTTLVGVEELGYEVERPRYKRLIPGLSRAEARRARAAAVDDLIARMLSLRSADPPLDLVSHDATAQLALEPSPLKDRDYKHREDLLDAVLCSWTAALWHRHGEARTQALGHPRGPGPGEVDAQGRRATIVAPCRPEQRRPLAPA